MPHVLKNLRKITSRLEIKARICNLDDIKVRICNLRYKTPRYIPVVFHNLSGYNVYLFIRELGRKCNSGSIGVIAGNNVRRMSALTLMLSWVCTRICGVRLRKRNFSIDSSTVLGLC